LRQQYTTIPIFLKYDTHKNPKKSIFTSSMGGGELPEKRVREGGATSLYMKSSGFWASNLSIRDQFGAGYNH
jgi:hypothetical protein